MIFCKMPYMNKWDFETRLINIGFHLCNAFLQQGQTVPRLKSCTVSWSQQALFIAPFSLILCMEGKRRREMKTI